MDRAHGKGLMTHPATKAKSVLLTEAGLREVGAAFHQLFDAVKEAARSMSIKQ